MTLEYMTLYSLYTILSSQHESIPRQSIQSIWAVSTLVYIYAYITGQCRLLGQGWRVIGSLLHIANRGSICYSIGKGDGGKIWAIVGIAVGLVRAATWRINRVGKWGQIIGIGGTVVVGIVMGWYLGKEIESRVVPLVIALTLWVCVEFELDIMLMSNLHHFDPGLSIIEVHEEKIGRLLLIPYFIRKCRKTQTIYYNKLYPTAIVR